MLLDCFPQPRPVILQGRLRIAAQLRVADLARLDAFLAAQAGDPFAEFTRCEGAERRNALRRAYDAAEKADMTSPIETTEGRVRLLTSLEGAATFLLLVFRDDQPPMSAEDAQELAAAMTLDDWQAVERIAFGFDALDELVALIDAEIGVELPIPADNPAAKKHTWRHVLAALCRRYHFPPAAIAELYLTQLRILLAGPDVDRGEEIPAGWSIEDYRQKILQPRAAFWAETD
jgi:hypothetical protein